MALRLRNSGFFYNNLQDGKAKRLRNIEGFGKQFYLNTVKVAAEVLKIQHHYREDMKFWITAEIFLKGAATREGVF